MNKPLLLLVPLAALFLLLAICHIRIGEALFTKQPLTKRLNIRNTTITIHNITHQLSLTIHTHITLRKPLPFVSSAAAIVYSPHPIDIVDHSSNLILVQADLTKPVVLSLAPPTSPRSSASRSEISLRLRFPSPASLPALLQQTSLNISLHLHQLDLRLSDGPLPAWLKRFARISLADLNLPLTIPIPELPPRWRDNPAALIQLDSYAFYAIPDPTGREEAEEVGMRATVRVPNPLVELRRWVDSVRLPSMGFEVPLEVLLPHPHHGGLVPLASAHSLPLPPLSSQDSWLTLAIEGSLHPSLAAYNGSDSPLTGFLNRFLNGTDNPIWVRYRPQSAGQDALDARAMVVDSGAQKQTRLMPWEDASQLPRYVEVFVEKLDFGMMFPGRAAGELVERLGVG